MESDPYNLKFLQVALAGVLPKLTTLTTLLWARKVAPSRARGRPAPVQTFKLCWAGSGNVYSSVVRMKTYTMLYAVKAKCDRSRLCADIIKNIN